MDANMRGISRKHDAETCTIANYTMHTRQESVMIYALKIFPYAFPLVLLYSSGGSDGPLKLYSLLFFSPILLPGLE
jgi:hypothetical protein